MRISFFTKPLAPLERFAKDCERRFNYLKYRLRGDAYKAWTCSYTLGGHQDLVDSFIKGAKYFPDVELLVNPTRKETVGSVAYVPCSWRVLRDVIKWKRSGVVDKLIAGPMICHEGPSEHGWIVTSDALDCYFLASEWVRAAYMNECRDAGRVIKNLRVYAAGVDENLWLPLDMKDNSAMRRALVYIKRSDKNAPDVSGFLERAGFEVRTLEYGTYVPGDYKELLEWCDFMVVLGGSETQGLALTQAWSMNRPTFVYESEDVLARGRDAAPYITPSTGAKWHDFDELRHGLAILPECEPRQWVLENQTNTIAFGNFMRIVRGL
ncbi:hypothetical protein [Cloacibacillus sp. An23]|uniref:hypothetical protein n=1 Tax=Cloacibacillus sp. An23 TaxID=1965591 RepID=UPI000B3992BD|nr:hypothetical protein [Cloacibacillus sp. An23]OUO93792.1 hypothetical protein B5F39_06330 [Cloacibacillus sp. An23]